MDLNHVDPVTGRISDLSTPEGQRQVVKLLGRDKPLVVGLSPECTLFSQLQSLRKSEIDPEGMANAVECVRFAVRVAEAVFLF